MEAAAAAAWLGTLVCDSNPGHGGGSIFQSIVGAPQGGYIVS